ncbi:MAG: PEGA domain-containing protein [Polyangiales bacterium]
MTSLHRVSCLLWFVVLGCAATSHAQAPAADHTHAAYVAIERAQELYDAQNYDAALSEFSAAYELLEGDDKRPAMLNNIALCHERRFRYDAALSYYERYLREASPHAHGRAAVQASIERLARLLVTLQLESNVPAEVWIDARKLGAAPGTLRVPAGEHALELRAPRYESARRAVALTAGTRQRLAFVLEPLSQYRGISPTYFWLSAGLTAAAVGVGAGFGIAALAADSEGRERARRDPYLNLPQDEQAVKQKARVADIAFASAGVLAVSSIVLFFVSDFASRSERQATPPIAVGLGSVTWSGLL